MLTDSDRNVELTVDDAGYVQATVTDPAHEVMDPAYQISMTEPRRTVMMLKLVMSFAIAASLAAPAMAQTAGTANMEILRQKIKADKKLVVADNLKLTDAEGAAFWPVYDAYQKDLQAIN